MIHISRGDVAIPSELNALWQKAETRLRGFFASMPASSLQRIQHTPEFQPTLWLRAESRLRVVFFEKCAYCETLLNSTGADIDHFRPKGGALNLSGEKSPEHYWWLAYEWRNLYLSCRECLASKGNKFPVKGPRAANGSSWTGIEEEKNLLLDPCVDNPDKHLVFSNDGLVTSTSERGEVTIDILNLNRSRLVESRGAEIENSQSRLLALGVIGDRTKARAIVEDLLSPLKPFAGARRQHIYRWLRENRRRWSMALDEEQVERLLGMVEAESAFVSSRKVKALTDRYKEAEQMIVRASPGKSRASRNFFFRRSQFITGIEIHNFKVIHDLRIRLDSFEDRKSWLVFLGENGTGKSSILKAVTLALISEEQRIAYGLRPAEFLRHGCRSGYVKVHLAGYRKPFELHFRRGADGFESNRNQLHTLLFSYGGTRLLPHGVYKHEHLNGNIRVKNLFDPFLPLTDARSWLLSLPDKPFEYSARALRQLLQHEGEGELRRQRGKRASIKLVFNSLGTSSTLEELSDGYQSVVALAVDIMEVMLAHWDAVEDSEGIVLIDEIDVHLHPRWRIEILELFRKVFPRVQFIITTHDPLCLVGTLPKEVYVLRREQHTKRIVAEQKDVPRGLTADQILTGFWFGLSSTVDDDTLRLLDEHRALMRIQAPETDIRRRELETRLRRRLGIFADTSLERMAQSVTAQVMQENLINTSREIDPQIRQNIREKILRIVRERQQRQT